MTLLTSQSRMERMLSTLGVTEYSDHDDAGAIDTTVVNDAMERATGEIEILAGQRYSTADLAGSELVMQWGTALACYFLCFNRGLTPPDGLQLQYEQIMARLERLQEGSLTIPGVPLSQDLRPAMSNRQVDRRFRRDTIRITKSNSTDAPTKLTQDQSITYPTIDI